MADDNYTGKEGGRGRRFVNWLAKILTNERVWAGVIGLVIVVLHALDGSWDDEI